MVAPDQGRRRGRTGNVVTQRCARDRIGLRRGAAARSARDRAARRRCSAPCPPQAPSPGACSSFTSAPQRPLSARSGTAAAREGVVCHRRACRGSRVGPSAEVKEEGRPRARPGGHGAEGPTRLPRPAPAVERRGRSGQRAALLPARCATRTSPSRLRRKPRRRQSVPEELLSRRLLRQSPPRQALPRSPAGRACWQPSVLSSVHCG